ncbi:hypothetical protein A5719_10265 [Mycolicibacterium peregrinum]|uniref:hypothetical protein n=1 Tax=Mycolicibacterium peregrinum TaxID=43304 RepID=UPI0007E9BE15|nr:hypothetical protein [Mycolicibacterium peregrinum]OBF42820.1 hypothetical protein A5719_10265 [Mycolicibacterium peregrinum]
MTAAVCRCHAPSGSGGRLAQLGRAKLRDDMTTPALHDQPAGCQCGRCAPPRWLPAEVEAAVRHLSNRQAVDLVLDRVAVSSFTSCDVCGAWVPNLRPVDTGAGAGRCEVVTLPVVWGD